MAFKLRLLLVLLGIVASACSASVEPPDSTRILLPPVAPVPSTTTSTLAPDPVAADLEAQASIRLALVVAEDVFTESGTYDVPGVESRSTEVSLIGLEDAAFKEGVVYDPYDQRVTLYAHSASGTWFCVDLSGAGTDYGSGDSFERALTACTDGALASDWGDPYSPTGPDESAIEAALHTLAEAMAAGDPGLAGTVFMPTLACNDLAEDWPSGLTLSESGELAIRSISFEGATAVATAQVGSFDHDEWELSKGGGTWQIADDPCRLFADELEDRMTITAAELIEVGLHAVRSAFVIQEGFDFGPDAVATFDAELMFVPLDEVSFGTLYYRGSPSAGLLVTAGPPGKFYCAVESVSASTAYGSSTAASDLRTPQRCRSRSNR